MRTLRSWWLEVARGLWVGDQVRVAHPSDRAARPSVVIRNAPEGYSAWCHRRNTGDFVAKAHVIPHKSPEGSELDTAPDDLVSWADMPDDVRRAVYQHLLSKGVTPGMFAPALLSYSDSRKRLVIELPGGIRLGRDLTGASAVKWVDYTPHTTNHTNVACAGSGGVLVLVEDVYSMVKVARVVGVRAMALLGTRVHPVHWPTIRRADHVLLALDGDPAGWAGGIRACRELRGLRPGGWGVLTLPGGKDPKDLHMQQLRELIQNGLSTGSGMPEQGDV